MCKQNFIFRDADGFNISDGKTRQFGVESLLTWQPTDELTISGNLSWARHEYDFALDLGGAEAVSSVRAIRTRIQITEPAFQVMGEYVANRDGQMRIDILADGTRVFTEAFDGGHGWQMSGDGSVSNMSEEGEEAVRHGIITNLFGLDEMTGMGLDLKYAGQDMIDGRAYERIDLTFDDGLVKHYYLDRDAGGVVQTIVVQEIVQNPAIDPVIFTRPDE